MKRVYVAGAFSPAPELTRSDACMDVFNNMRKGIDACIDLLIEGFHPFCPWLDYHYVLGFRGAAITDEMLYAMSLEWLDVSDAVYVLEGSEQSLGTKREIERAHELGIPVYYNRNDLMALTDK